MKFWIFKFCSLKSLRPLIFFKKNSSSPNFFENKSPPAPLIFFGNKDFFYSKISVRPLSMVSARLSHKFGPVPWPMDSYTAHAQPEFTLKKISYAFKKNRKNRKITKKSKIKKKSKNCIQIEIKSQKNRKIEKKNQKIDKKLHENRKRSKKNRKIEK